MIGGIFELRGSASINRGGMGTIISFLTQEKRNHSTLNLHSDHQ